MTPFSTSSSQMVEVSASSALKILWRCLRIALVRGLMHELTASSNRD